MTIQVVRKPGKHGTLYLYEVVYTDHSDYAIGQIAQRVWAYNAEHAEIKFRESVDADGWDVLRVTRAK